MCPNTVDKQDKAEHTLLATVVGRRLQQATTQCVRGPLKTAIGLPSALLWYIGRRILYSYMVDSDWTENSPVLRDSVQ